MLTNSIYLSEWGGTGTSDDPFRPYIVTQYPGIRYQVFDLRTIEQQDATSGYCLLSLEFDIVHSTLIPVLDVDIHDSYDVDGAEFAQTIQDKMGVQCEGSTFREVLASLLIDHRGLRSSTVDEAYILRLYGHEIFLREAPAFVVSGGATSLPNNLPIWEGFNGDNSSTIGVDQTWTEVTGDLSRTNNKIVPTTTTAGYAAQARCEATTLTTDHYAVIQWDIGAGATANDYGEVEVSVRWNASNSERYALIAFEDATPINKWVLYKISSTNTYTSLQNPGNTNIDLSANSATKKLIKLAISGSQLYAWSIYDSHQVILFSHTDSTYSGSVRGGIGLKVGATAGNYRAIDNFYMDDIKGGWAKLLSSASHSVIVDSATSATSYSGTMSTCNSTEANLVAVFSRTSSGTPNTPTLSGCGLTWDQIGSSAVTTYHKVTVFRARNLRAFSSGSLTASFAAQTQTYCTIAQFRFPDPADPEQVFITSAISTNQTTGAYDDFITPEPALLATTGATSPFNPLLFVAVGMYDSGVTSVTPSYDMNAFFNTGGNSMEIIAGYYKWRPDRGTGGYNLVSQNANTYATHLTLIATQYDETRAVGAVRP